MTARRAAVESRGFILVQDTLCYGIVPAERDGRDALVLYRTRAEAEAERADAVEMRADALRDDRLAPDDAEDGPWVEAAAILSDGSLMLIDLGMRLSTPELRTSL